MNAQEARDLGANVAALLQMGQLDHADAMLSPVLAARTPFRMLRTIGSAIGAGPLDVSNSFLDCIAAGRTEGGWVVIASALAEQLDRDSAGAFAHCRDYIVAADVWYAADIMGEGVPGVALVNDFGPSLTLLAPWRADANHWVRRAVGTSVHFWAKRMRGASEKAQRAKTLLAFLEPMFGEWDMIAVKGVGWGLKTLGKHYPELMADWLAEDVIPSQHRYRTLMLRKALTHLSEEQRARVVGATKAL